MAIILSVVALVLAFAGGLGMVVLLGRPSSFSRAELCGMAVVLGAGLVSLSSFLLGILMYGWVLRSAVSVLCLGSLVIALRRDRGAFAVKLPERFVPSVAPILTSVFAVAALYLLVWISLYHSDLGWDGLFNWEAKTRTAFLNDGVFPFQAFSSGLLHTRYPLLVPLFGAWIYSWLGRVDQSMLKLVGPFFYLGALLLLAGSARRLTGSPWAGALAVLILAAVPPTMIGGGSASSGYADWPLAVIYLCTLIATLEYTRTNSAPAARLAGVTLMLGIWTKADMLVLLVCIAAVAAPRIIRERNWKLGLVIFLPALAMRFIWSVMLVVVKAPPDGDFHFRPHFDVAGMLLQNALSEFIKWKQWGLFWPLLGLAVFLYVIRRHFSEVAVWTGGVILPMILYPCVFIFSAWNPIHDHVASSLSRLFLQIVPAASLFIALTIHRVFEADNRGGRSTLPLSQAGAGEDQAEILISAAAAVLQPIGITADDLRELYRRRLEAKSASENSICRPQRPGKKNLGRTQRTSS